MHIFDGWLGILRGASCACVGGLGWGCGGGGYYGLGSV